MKKRSKIKEIFPLEHVRVRFNSPGRDHRDIEDRPWEFETTGYVELVTSDERVEDAVLVFYQDDEEDGTQREFPEGDFRAIRLDDIYSVKVLP